MQKDKLMKKLIANAKAEQQNKPRPIVKVAEFGINPNATEQSLPSPYIPVPAYVKELNETRELQSIFSNFKGKFK